MTNAREIQSAHGRLVALESAGTGPTLVIAHSNSTSADLYEPLLSGIARQGRRTLALHLPGHGLSDWSPPGTNGYAIPELASAVIEAVAALAPGPCVLVGHSLGGHVMTTALERIPNVAGLLLISAPPLRPNALGQIFRPDPTNGALFRADLSDGDVELFANSLVAPGVVPEDLVASVRNAIRATDPRFREELGASVGRGEIANEAAVLATTPVPTALVYGVEDRFIDVAYYDRVELASPWRGGLFPFPGSGHSPHWDAPQRFSQLLDAFMHDCVS